MSNMENRQRCFDYLLEDMNESERSHFDNQLKMDQSLLYELRKCEEDLANFAEASVLDESPPTRVWDNILSGLELAQTRSRGKTVNVSKISGDSFWKYVWPVAACILLVFNFAQWYSGKGAKSIANQVNEDMYENNGYVVESDSHRQMRGEIVELREKVSELNASLEMADSENQNRVIAELNALDAERRILIDRIELLETNYLTLVDVARPLLDDGFLSGIGGVFEADESQDEVSENLPAGIWDRLASLVGTRNIAVLSMGIHPVEVGGYESYSPPEAFDDTVALDPYALSFVNRGTGQAILSLGNLPITESNETLVVWASSEETETLVEIGELPRTLQGTSSDIGFQLPEGFENTSDFILSIEEVGDAARVVPSDRTVANTFDSP